MAITADSLRWYQSERMTDEDDGGGQMTGHEIVPGIENQVFDDLSDVDRAAGDISLRKVYAAVGSLDDDKYLDAGAIVFRHPRDPDVSVTVFSTGDYYDEREQAQELLESSITRGERLSAWLWGDHFAGQRVITIWQRFTEQPPANGSRLDLVAMVSNKATHNQILWVTSVTVDDEQRVDNNGSYWVRKVILELAEALRHDFIGVDPSRTDIHNPATAIFGTRYNPEVVELCGIRPLVADAQTGDYTVQVDSLYAPLIPTAMVETPLADTNPGGGTATLVQAGPGQISFTTTLDCIKPGVSLFIGSGVWPGTLSIAIGGSTITDTGGILYRSGDQVGVIDYGTGICTWADTSPSYGTSSKIVRFIPAARPLKVADTTYQQVGLENRGFVWVKTIAPPPAPGSLQVSYQTNREWYTLTDNGAGILRGADSSYGTGSINYTSGTVTLTLGALPDPESQILFAWANPVTFVQQGGVSTALKFKGKTDHGGMIPLTFSLTWQGGVSAVQDDGVGNLSGSGTGRVNYTTGEWEIEPDLVPSKGATISAAYDYGGTVKDNTPSLNPDAGENVYFTLSQAPEPGTVRIYWNCGLYRPTVDSQALTTGGWAKDDGTGKLVDQWLGEVGTINYITREVILFTAVNGVIYTPVYKKICEDAPQFIGKESPPPQCVKKLVEYRVTTGYLTAAANQSYQVEYRPDGQSVAPGTETTTITSLSFDITPQLDERLTPGSVRFTFGNSVYIASGATIYRDPSPATGIGIFAGTLDSQTGTVTLTEWVGGGTAGVWVNAALTEIGSYAVGSCSFRTPTANIRPGTLQLRWVGANNTQKNKTPDSSGYLEDSDATITVDFSRGVVHLFFGRWWKVADLTPEQMEEDWYDESSIVFHAGHESIWEGEMVFADTVIYNAVAQVTLPPDSRLLGLDAARLPPDGTALIFRTGMLALIHNTGHFIKPTLLADEVIDCGRTRLYRVVIEDTNGLRLTQDLYTVDRATGIVTMADPLDLADYTPPFTVYHSVADLQRVRDTDISGRLTFLRQVSHDYPADSDSYVSGMLYIGTLQARYKNLFEQTAWTNVWSDTRIGDQPLASYNDALHPIIVTNAGTYPDRYLFRFISTTTFQCIGENLGMIGEGSTQEDFAPSNPLTGQPFFTVSRFGWGGAWAAGNCLRFNIVGACYPVQMVRATQPSEPTELPDSVEVLLIGNVDAN